MKPSPYPLFLDLRDRLCVVVGGGAVAARKVRALLAGGARVRLISPAVTKALSRLAGQGRIELTQREYRKGDLEGACLAFAATGREEVNSRVRAESQRLAVPLNVADEPDLCDFLVPSTVRRGPIIIAISTSGLLPMLSKKVRQEIAQYLTADHSAYARRVGSFRRYLLQNVKSPGLRREIMRRVGGADFREVARMSLREMKERFLHKKGLP
jgi:siroheme synthase-like protein